MKDWIYSWLTDRNDCVVCVCFLHTINIIVRRLRCDGHASVMASRDRYQSFSFSVDWATASRLLLPSVNVGPETSGKLQLVKKII